MTRSATTKSRRKARTPRSRVKHTLQKLFLTSRERHQALKRDRYSCVRCGIKQSRAKGKHVYVEVDHIDGIDWEALINLIYERVLVSPEKLQTLCKADHLEKTLLESLNVAVDDDSAVNDTGM